MKFEIGNTFGKGRPQIHPFIKILRDTSDETAGVTLTESTLKAIAQRDVLALNKLHIPRSQVTSHERILAAGYLFLKKDAE